MGADAASELAFGLTGGPTGYPGLYHFFERVTGLRDIHGRCDPSRFRSPLPCPLTSPKLSAYIC
jgi:hypothetical protein